MVLSNAIVRSERRLPTLTGTDPDRVEHGEHEDLAVADAAAGRHLADRLNDLEGEARRDDDLDLELRNEVDDVGRTAVDLALAPGSTKAPDLADRHAADAELGQPLLDVVEREGAN